MPGRIRSRCGRVPSATDSPTSASPSPWAKHLRRPRWVRPRSGPKGCGIMSTRTHRITILMFASTACGCFSGGGGSSTNGDTDVSAVTSESCMRCHNGAPHDDYAGHGLENPHPFPGAATLKCTECHGGDPAHYG